VVTLREQTARRRSSLAKLAEHLRATGYRLDEHPPEAWAGLIRRDRGNSAAPVLDIFLAELTGTGWSSLTFAPTPAVPACPPLDPLTLATYVAYFTGTGFLPHPGDAG
jgi:hypothetical protein